MNVPSELTTMILGNFPHRDIINRCRTNKVMINACNDPKFWSDIIDYRYGLTINCLDTMKITHLLLEQNLIRSVQIMEYRDKKFQPIGNMIL